MMMKQLSVQKLAEPDVELYVPCGTDLPEEVRKVLELYSSVFVANVMTGETGRRYRIPAYLEREWLEKYDLNPKITHHFAFPSTGGTIRVSDEPLV